METYAAEDWDDVFDVNLRGVANGVQAVYPWAGSYAASKHAVVGLARTLRVEARRFGVRASVLCPGVVRNQAVIVVPGWFKASGTSTGSRRR